MATIWQGTVDKVFAVIDRYTDTVLHGVSSYLNKLYSNHVAAQPESLMKSAASIARRAIF